MTIDCRNIITLEPGKRGLRITVYDVLAWLTDGMTEAEILKDYPELKETDIRACLAFAANRKHDCLALV